MNSFLNQQFRWAKGSIQTARKLLPTILRSPLEFKVKLEAFFHLTANCSYPLMVVLSLLVYPALLIRSGMSWYGVALIDFPLFFAATLSVSSFYLVSQVELYPDWRSRIRFLPFVLSTGIGLSVNNSRAVLEGLAGRQSPFVRTPKYAVGDRAEDWRGLRYRMRCGFAPVLEVALGIYLLLASYDALVHGLSSLLLDPEPRTSVS